MSKPPCSVLVVKFVPDFAGLTPKLVQTTDKTVSVLRSGHVKAQVQLSREEGAVSILFHSDWMPALQGAEAHQRLLFLVP